MNIFRNKPTIRILEHIKNNDVPNALLISVKNGRGSLKTVLCKKSDYHDDFVDFHKLMLNGKPIVQNYTSVSPTSSGLLAAGYGLKNISCKELIKINDMINEDFVSLEKSLEIISPLLGLLETGIYLLADIPHIPTDGQGGFFWNVQNEKKYYDAHCIDYWHNDILTAIPSYPKYLYPSQDTKCYDKDRVEEYVKRYKAGENPLRAIAFNLGTFMSVLLDGHHKACAAALLGRNINCLTIMSIQSIYNEEKESVNFCGDIKLFTDELKYPELSLYIQKLKNDWQIDDEYSADNEPLHSEIFKPIDDERYNAAAKKYLTVEDIAFRKYFGIKKITKEYIDNIFEKLSQEKIFALIETTLIEIIRTESIMQNPLAEYAAARVIKIELSNIQKGYIVNKNLLDTAIYGLMNFKSEKTEKIMIDLITESSLDKKTLDLIKDYWE